MQSSKLAWREVGHFFLWAGFVQAPVAFFDYISDSLHIPLAYSSLFAIGLTVAVIALTHRAEIQELLDGKETKRKYTWDERAKFAGAVLGWVVCFWWREYIL